MTDEEPGNARVLVMMVDGLRPAFLGPYGNTWFETPTFDGVSAAATLFEHVFTETDDLLALYRRWWDQPPSDRHPSPLGPGHRVVVTDDPLVGRLATDADVDDVRQCAPPAFVTADAIESTHMAAVLAEAFLAWQELPAPGCLWVHLQGWSGPWDAPSALRDALADEDDPPPPTFVPPPFGNWALEEDVDPDRLLGLAQAYAAQLQVLDACLSPFADWFAQRPEDPAAWLLTAPRGYPLGEHGIVGRGTAELACAYAETAHVPLWIWDRRLGDASRDTSLRSLTTFDHLLRASHSPCVTPPNLPSSLDVQDLATTHSHSQWSVRTDRWSLIRSARTETARLYVRPDDYWEANDVADLVRTECAELMKRSDALVHAAGGPSDTDPQGSS